MDVNALEAIKLDDLQQEQKAIKPSGIDKHRE